MRKTVAGVVGILVGLLFGSGGSFAQCSRIIQNGTVQNNAAVVWVAPCVLGQAGPSSGSPGFPPMINDLGVQGSLGLLTGPNSGPYNWGLLGWSQSTPGEFDINLSAVGGAPQATAALILNGIKYPLPGSISANVVGPTSPFATSGDLALWNGGTTLRDGGPPVLGPTSPFPAAGDAVAWSGTALGLVDAGALPGLRVKTVAALRALPVLTLANNTSVVVESYVTGGDMPPVTYEYSTSACTINAGNGDGGSQIKSSAGTCWLLTPQPVYDIRNWGISLTPGNCAYAASVNCVNVYADSVHGNDYSGANFCTNVAIPCATTAQALTSGYKFCVANGTLQLNLAAGSYGRIQVSGKPTCGGGQGPGGGGFPVQVVGAGVATTSVTDPCTPSCALDVVEASEGASIQLLNLTIATPATDDGVFAAGVGSTIILANSTYNLEISGAGALAAIHAEGQNRVLEAGSATVIIHGTFTNIANLTYNSNATFAGTFTCDNTATFTGGAMLGANQGSTFYLNNSNFSTCPNTISPFKLTQDSAATVGSAVFPSGSPPPILVAKSSTEDNYAPCVGGDLNCPIVTAPTGTTGASGATWVVSTRSTVWGGQVQITAGSGTPTAGTIWLSAPVLLQTATGGAMIDCIANVGFAQGVTNATAWPAATQVWIGADSATGGTNFRINWTTGTGLTSTDVYALNWVCSD